MGRLKNDGLGRFGGRPKGAKNKPLSPVTEWIETQVNKNRGFIENQMKTPWTDVGVKLLSALVIAAAINDATAAAIGVTEDEPTPENYEEQ